MSTAEVVESAVRSAEAAVAVRDAERLEAAYGELSGAPKALLAECAGAVGPRLAALLPGMPQWHASVYAVFTGALVEYGADAEACAPPILAGLRTSLRRAVDFAVLWRERYGEDVELPDPEGMPDPEQQAAFGEEYLTVWHRPYLGWFTVAAWERAAVAVLADPAVRRTVADREELLELIEQLEPDHGDLRCAHRALQLLDEEPLLVLDRASGRAFRLRMSGIADNYQLQTLLSGVLVGGGLLPGEAPDAEALALSTDGEVDLDRLDRLPHLLESFSLAEPSGRWIWSETTPSRIPLVDGVRTLVLDPPVLRHHYPAVRFLPRVPGRLVLDEALEPADAARYFADVQALMSWEDACRIAENGY